MDRQTRNVGGGFVIAIAAILSMSGHVRAQSLPPPAPVPPVAAFGQVPAVTDIDINPAGTHLAWIDGSGKLPRIVIFDLTAKREARSLNLPADSRPTSVYWANDATLISSVRMTYSHTGKDRDQRAWQRWFAIDVAGGSPRMLLAQPGSTLQWVTGSTLVRRQTARPGKIFLSSWDSSATQGRKETGTRIHRGRLDSNLTYNLFEVDLKSGDADLLERGTQFTEDWVADPTGKITVRSEWDPTREKFSIHAKDGSGWRQLYEAGRCGQLGKLRLNADNTAVVVRGSRCGEDRVKLWSLPLDGSAMTALVEDPASDVLNLFTDPVDDTVIAASFAGSDMAMRWLDPRAEKRRGGLIRSFGAEWVSILGRSSDGQRIVVKANYLAKPSVFHFVDFGAKRADIVNEEYPQLADVKLGTFRRFKYEASDKYPLMAYLTVPADTPEKNLPLIVLPHGGPESCDNPLFDYWPQFLASRGYAVIQPQFRGSSCFGKAHADAGRHQWGLRMQDDVTDVVHALTAQGIADPKRVCIVGWSYGGYAALAGAAFTPDLYACAVSIAGVSDLPLMVGYVDRMAQDEEDSRLDYWREHIGLVTDPQVIAKSPARAVRGVRSPILMIHGWGDTVVPIEQSRVMALALKDAGKKYELIELPGEDHNLENSEMRTRMLTELEKFLARNLPPAAPTN
jgi:dipeptidyl aminopeptidase/acylaminoacyl peptidase